MVDTINIAGFKYDQLLAILVGVAWCLPGAFKHTHWLVLLLVPLLLKLVRLLITAPSKISSWRK